MPRVPIVDGSEIVRAFERLGSVQVRQRGSHVVLRRGEQGCVVPLYHEVKTGTPAGIVRQSSLTMDQFLAAS